MALEATPPSAGCDATATTWVGSLGSAKKSDGVLPAAKPPAVCQEQDASSENASPSMGDSA